MAEYQQWFRVAGTDVRWLKESPANRVSRCDKRFDHVVQPDSPRLQTDTGMGPTRKRGKGKQHEYLCVPCAKLWYGVDPPPLMDQEVLF